MGSPWLSEKRSAALKGVKTEPGPSVINTNRITQHYHKRAEIQNKTLSEGSAVNPDVCSWNASRRRVPVNRRTRADQTRLTHVVGSILAPVDRGLSVLLRTGLVPRGGRCRGAAGLLLGQLVAEGLLPRLHHVGHHGVYERQRLDGPTVEDRAVLPRQRRGQTFIWRHVQIV